MEEISENMTNKTIEKIDINSENDSLLNSKIFSFHNCPYIKTNNSSQIPIIELLNERTMKFNNTEKDIKSYNDLVQNKKIDYNYNKCQICHEKYNKYYYEKCSKNICEECSKKVSQECSRHHLSRLKEQKQLINCIKKK